MKIDLFKKSSAGTLSKALGGYWTYLPNPLPPQISPDWSLINRLSEADRALSKLSGLGSLLPNPHLLISPYIRKEAVLSSRIEGTVTLVEDLLFVEAEPSEIPSAPDWKTVRNYVNAMNFGLSRLSTLPLSLRLVREIHEILMQEDKSAMPGEFRTAQNYIAPPGTPFDEATFVPPPPEKLATILAKWEKYLHTATIEPPLIQCALMHYQFEAIHPFKDGNGRVGRLLITLFLCERGLMSQPLLYLSAYLEKHRDEYYNRLLEVSQKGAWLEWISFFLRGVVEQANAASKLTENTLNLQSKYREQIGNTRVPQAALKLMDHIFFNPVISVSHLASTWKMHFPTVQTGVNYLVKHGVLEEVTGRPRNRLYVARELYDLVRAN
jgi:Fic family protein